MPKRTRIRASVSGDPNVLAHQSVQAVAALSGEPTNNLPADMLHEVMAAMGRKGGRIGGKRRLETMTAEERTAAALKAARARWKKKRRKRQG
jgi:hypothetical protein